MVHRVHKRYRQIDDRQTDDRRTDGQQHIANVNVSSRSLKMDAIYHGTVSVRLAYIRHLSYALQ